MAEPADETLKAGVKLVGRYRLDNLLGAGAMGQVWQSTDLLLDRPVAIKVVPTNPYTDNDLHLLMRLKREARAAAKLDHPGITTIFDYGDEAGHLFLVMQLVEGGDLRRMVRSNPEGLPIVSALDLIGQIADALSAAHDRQVIHRDLKPANLMITPAGRIKICDFGIAWYAGATSLTKAGTTVGTPLFMAPEQWQGEKPDHRTDLYALGCLSYSLLTGRPPYRGDNPYSLMNKHLNDRPPRPRSVRGEIPEAVENLMLELIAKDPADRPESASAVSRRLRDILESLKDTGTEEGAVLNKKTKKSWIKGEDILLPCELELAQTVNGCVHTITFETHAICTDCAGSGSENGADGVTCPICRGGAEKDSCQSCLGQGIAISNLCPVCAGEGRVEVLRTIKVRIPGGIEDGSHIQLAGEGRVGRRGSPASDVYLKIIEKPHHIFKRKFDDLHCRMRVTMTDAALGSVVTVRALDDSTFEVEIPPGTQPGQKLRIRGRGARHLSEDGHGDLIIDVEIAIPRDLTPHQESILRYLSDLQTTKSEIISEVTAPSIELNGA